MSGELTKDRCPRCGSPLLSDGTVYWCSFVGGREEKACAFGIDKPVGELTMATIRARGGKEAPPMPARTF